MACQLLVKQVVDMVERRNGVLDVPQSETLWYADLSLWSGSGRVLIAKEEEEEEEDSAYT